jgi:hypothetical protein
MTAAPRVLLCRLNIRPSARGTEYLSGFLGCARVIAFRGKEPDKFGNPVWEVFVSEPAAKDDAPRQEILPPERPTRGQSTRAAVRDLPTGRTVEQRNERRDPRQDRIDDLAARFKPDEEIPF